MLPDTTAPRGDALPRTDGDTGAPMDIERSDDDRAIEPPVVDPDDWRAGWTAPVMSPRSDSAGQSGDEQGLSPIADAADESVEELVETGQSYEAEIVAGVEDAADHPERPVPSHEV